MRKTMRIALIISVALLFLFLGLYFLKFHSGLSDKHEAWSSFGNYFGAITGLLSFLGVVGTLFLTLKINEENKRITEDSETRKMFYQTLDLLTNTINEVDYHDPVRANHSKGKDALIEIARDARDYHIAYLAYFKILEWEHLQNEEGTIKIDDVVIQDSHLLNGLAALSNRHEYDNILYSDFVSGKLKTILKFPGELMEEYLQKDTYNKIVDLGHKIIKFRKSKHNHLVSIWSNDYVKRCFVENNLEHLFHSYKFAGDIINEAHYGAETRPYFRMIFYSFQFTGKAKLSEDTRAMISDHTKALLTQYEIALLFYDAASSFSVDETRELFRENNVFKNLIPENVSMSLLTKEEKQSLVETILTFADMAEKASCSERLPHLDYLTKSATDTPNA